jgi:hypothetical protein
MDKVISDSELAQLLLARIRKLLGGDAWQIEQIFFYDCSVDDPHSIDIMAYVYLLDGRECEICFERPPLFDPVAIECLLMAGDVAPATVH